MNKIIIIKGFLLLAILGGIAESQILQQAWVVDNGGGRSSGAGLIMLTSIGQPVTQSMSGAGYFLQSGFLPATQPYSSTGTTTVAASVEANWNLLSLPVKVQDNRRTIIFPTATSSGFRYDHGYIAIDSLPPGKGFWIKFASASTVSVSGYPEDPETMQVAEKWNIIGSLATSVPVSNIRTIGTSVVSQYYGYSNGTGYGSVTTLQPGKGYWVKVNGAGSLILRSGSLLERTTPALTKARTPEQATISSSANTPALPMLRITDAKGKEGVLYFSSAVQELDMMQYELPPVPPAGIFDIRYATQQSAAIPDVQKTGEQTFGIEFRGCTYPLTVKWDASSNALLFIDGKKMSLVEQGTLQLRDPESTVKLKLTPDGTLELPKTFALLQNYPNPFNPTTTIRYDLPQDAFVTITLYNILGAEVATLTNDQERAGYKSFVWNAADYPSGVYYYRIVAMGIGKESKSQLFVDVKKMLLVK